MIEQFVTGQAIDSQFGKSSKQTRANGEISCPRVTIWEVVIDRAQPQSSQTSVEDNLFIVATVA
jgi:hypothetical protein